MELRFSTTLIAAFLLSNGFAYADEKPLSWQECLTLATQKNPDLISSQKSVDSRESQLKDSYNEVMPRADLSNSYITSKGDTGQTKHWSSRLSASIDIFNMSNYAAISSARSGLDQSEASLRLASSTVLRNLRRAFLNLLFTQEQIGVSERILQLRSNNARLVSLRYESGRESKGNMLRSKAELLQAEKDLNASNRGLTVAREELERQIGESNFQIIKATGTLTTPAVVDETPPLDALTDAHPRVALRLAEVSSSEAALRRARSSYWPNLSANYSRSFQGRTYFPDEPDWSAGGTLSLPIFSAGPTSSFYSVDSAKREREVSQENLRSARYDIRVGLETAWATYANNVEDVSVQEAFLESSRQRNSEADIRYSNGLMSYDDWERIVTDRVDFERSVIRAWRDAGFAEADWNNARGLTLGESL